MAKKRERIEINGVNFIIENTTVLDDNRRYFRTLYECYERPSKYKEAIYDDWCNYFAGLGCILECGIVSYNCMQFTFGAYFTYNAQKYYAYITKSYNRLYKVV